MGIDRETQLNWLTANIENKPAYIKQLKAAALEDGLDDQLSVDLNDHVFQMEEMYYDPNENDLTISGVAKSTNGESYFHISVPISDIVLVDILAGAMKKFNKLKGALESLK